MSPDSRLRGRQDTGASPVGSASQGSMPPATQQPYRALVPPMATFSTNRGSSFNSVNQLTADDSSTDLNAGGAVRQGESAKNNEMYEPEKTCDKGLGTPLNGRQVFERRVRAPRKVVTQEVLDERTRRRRYNKAEADKKYQEVLKGPHETLLDGTVVSIEEYNERKQLQIEVPCVYMNDCMTGGFRRKCISHVFGRNKKVTRSIPIKIWITMCRKHYQREKYRVTEVYAREQSFLVMEQFRRLEEWGEVLFWTIKPRKAEVDRLKAEQGILLPQFDTPARASKGKGKGKGRPRTSINATDPRLLKGLDPAEVAAELSENNEEVRYSLGPSDDGELDETNSIFGDESLLFNSAGVLDVERKSSIIDDTREDSAMIDAAEESSVLSDLDEEAVLDLTNTVSNVNEIVTAMMEEDQPMGGVESVDQRVNLNDDDTIDENHGIIQDESGSEEDDDSDDMGEGEVDPAPQRQRVRKQPTTDADMLVGPWAFILDHVGDKSAAEAYELMKMIHAVFDKWAGLDYPAIEILPHLSEKALLQKVPTAEQSRSAESRHQLAAKALALESNDRTDAKAKFKAMAAANSVNAKTTIPIPKTKVSKSKTGKSNDSNAGKNKATGTLDGLGRRVRTSRQKAVKLRSDSTETDVNMKSESEEEVYDDLYDISPRPPQLMAAQCTQHTQQSADDPIPSTEPVPPVNPDNPHNLPAFFFGELNEDVHQF